MNKKFVAILTSISLMTGVAYAEEASHNTRDSGSNPGVSAGLSTESRPERPEPSEASTRPANTIPLPAGRIMSGAELNRAGLKPDDVVMHISVF